MIFQSPQNPNAHLTVKEREKASFPTLFLYNNKLLKGKILDFGCGLGADIAFLEKENYDIKGYDPYYLPDYPNEKFDTIICNYVLNVLLPEEQSYVLMCISELLKPTGKAYFAVRRDITKNAFIYNPKRQITVYQCNIILPYQSILLTKHCEIYQYQHYNQILNKNLDNKDLDYNTCDFCNLSPNKELISELATIYSIYHQGSAVQGHAIIIPKKHVSDYFELALREQMAIWIMVNRVKNILLEKYKPHGFHVEFGVDKHTISHTHIHILPQYKVLV